MVVDVQREDRGVCVVVAEVVLEDETAVVVVVKIVLPSLVLVMKARAADKGLQVAVIVVVHKALGLWIVFVQQTMAARGVWEVETVGDCIHLEVDVSWRQDCRERMTNHIAVGYAQMSESMSNAVIAIFAETHGLQG